MTKVIEIPKDIELDTGDGKMKAFSFASFCDDIIKGTKAFSKDVVMIGRGFVLSDKIHAAKKTIVLDDEDHEALIKGLEELAPTNTLFIYARRPFFEALTKPAEGKDKDK